MQDSFGILHVNGTFGAIHTRNHLIRCHTAAFAAVCMQVAECNLHEKVENRLFAPESTLVFLLFAHVFVLNRCHGMQSDKRHSKEHWNLLKRDYSGRAMRKHRQLPRMGVERRCAVDGESRGPGVPKINSANTMWVSYNEKLTAFFQVRPCGPHCLACQATQTCFSCIPPHQAGRRDSRRGDNR